MGSEQSFEGAYPIIDDMKLQSIKDLAEPDDADGFFSELLQIFFQRAPQLMSEIETAIQSGDAQKLERSSHALKGTSGNLGAVRMMHLAEQLEMKGRAKVIDDAARPLSDELLRVYPLTKAELEKSLSF